MERFRTENDPHDNTWMLHCCLDDKSGGPGHSLSHMNNLRSIGAK